MKKKWLLGLVGTLVMSTAQTTEAYRNRPPAFRREHSRVIVMNHDRFWYNNGYFYRQARNNFIAVSAPLGAIVLSLPPTFETVIVGGRPYYCYEDVYYVRTEHGYVVTEKPTVDAPITVTPTPSETYTVTIQNTDGTLTPITITKLANGFQGPQGEYYPQFPKVAQLKVMYGK